MIKDWQKYHQQTKGYFPSPLLVKAMTFVTQKEESLDLGAGGLKDSKYLLSHGFKKVTAVDSETIGAEILLEFLQDNFEYIHLRFEKLAFPTKKYNIITAQYSLPFTSPQTFPSIWNNIKSSLSDSGIFTGQLFGINDEWNKPGTEMTFHTKEQIIDLLEGMEIIELREEETDRQLADGTKKHWHIFHLILKAD